jgi:hypothetical protein
MDQTTLDVTRRERLGAWFYTGPVGRLVSFSIDLALSLGALALWSTRKAWRRLRGGQSPAA